MEDSDLIITMIIIIILAANDDTRNMGHISCQIHLHAQEVAIIIQFYE